MSGGGTLRKDAPQMGQESDCRTEARTQWPRASHRGFVHWTVEPGRKVIAISPRCRPDPCVQRLEFIEQTLNFHRIVMRTKNGVNRNCSDEGSFFEELWKSVEAAVNCCRIGTAVRDESKQAANT